MMPAILARVERRRQNWEVTADDILPAPETLGEVCIVGNFSICGLSSRRRFLLRPVCIETPAGLETPPTLARDYLTVVYHRGPRAMSKQIDHIRRNLTGMPLFAAPTTFSNGFYLDIASTYLTMMSIAGWNVDYYPAHWLGRGRPPLDFPWAENKLARNCLVSAGLGGNIQVYQPGKGYSSLRTGNHLANLQLYGLIVDVLNSIAVEMLEAGAIYVNTDGYILPDYPALERAVKILAGWHLPQRVKASGAGVVRGAGTYYIGPVKQHVVRREPAAINKVSYLPSRDWLKERFIRFSREVYP